MTTSFMKKRQTHEWLEARYVELHYSSFSAPAYLKMYWKSKRECKDETAKHLCYQTAKDWKKHPHCDCWRAGSPMEHLCACDYCRARRRWEMNQEARYAELAEQEEDAHYDRLLPEKHN